MQDIVDQVIQLLATNRRRYPKPLKKVRVDRLSKLAPEGIDVGVFLEAFLADPRIKRVRKKDMKTNKLVPAVELHNDAYRRLTR